MSEPPYHPVLLQNEILKLQRELTSHQKENRSLTGKVAQQSRDAKSAAEVLQVGKVPETRQSILISPSCLKPGSVLMYVCEWLYPACTHCLQCSHLDPDIAALKFQRSQSLFMGLHRQTNPRTPAHKKGPKSVRV